MLAAVGAPADEEDVLAVLEELAPAFSELNNAELLLCVALTMMYPFRY
ncbi:MAG: hypothetical protein AWT59_0128 [Candidatus Gallionella acididurans]|uniref:Uncharacterized protein n=1 Tax=Candidatus Gallionella acididurans TaxID=1796491 RepID=A0A139BXX2_9PROT|nr:MAG: hypothetical protein AWT59_0128 [Candidatus Gallionella acididurans]